MKRCPEVLAAQNGSIGLRVARVTNRYWNLNQLNAIQLKLDIASQGGRMPMNRGENADLVIRALVLHKPCVAGSSPAPATNLDCVLPAIV